MTLTTQQRDTMYVLGYLFLRMGRFKQADRVFDALAVLDPQDQWVQRNLAVISLEKGEGAKALLHLEKALGNTAPHPRDALLLLVQAKALWLEGQQEKARSALKKYLLLAGEAV